MTVFGRGLRDEAIIGLAKLAEVSGDNWWKDLLRRWVPSGGGPGLRLAVRDNTLDFYARGSRVAHIAFGSCKRGEPAPVRAECDVKYVFPELEFYGEERPRPAVLRSDADHWTWGDRTTRKSFELIEQEIAKRVAKFREDGHHRRGLEKDGVDEIVGNNQAVIDLEMGLPAWRSGTGALRMDLVALEGRADEIKIVFWEAKTFDDPRLRKRDGDAEIIDQLTDDYAAYLCDGDRRRRVNEAYRECCDVLVKLHNMRGGIPPLHPLVVAAAQKDSRLEVDEKPRLVIFGYDQREESGEAWKRHKAKLVDHGIEPMMMSEARQIRLPI